MAENGPESCCQSHFQSQGDCMNYLVGGNLSPNMPMPIAIRQKFANTCQWAQLLCDPLLCSRWLDLTGCQLVVFCFFSYMNVLLLSISIVLIQLNRHPGRTISVKEFQNIRFRSMTLYLHLYVNFRVYSWKQTCYFSQFIPVNHHGVIIASNWPHSVADWSQTDSTLTL